MSGWVDKQHACQLPLICHESQAKVGRLFECDHCHATWRVQASVFHDEYHNRALTFIRVSEPHTRSWMEQ